MNYVRLRQYQRAVRLRRTAPALGRARGFMLQTEFHAAENIPCYVLENIKIRLLKRTCSDRSQKTGQMDYSISVRGLSPKDGFDYFTDKNAAVSQKICNFADDLNEKDMKKSILSNIFALAAIAAIFLFGACKQIPTGEIFEVKNDEGIAINYMVTDGDAKQIEVVGKFIDEYQNTYAGTIFIPQTVEYEGNKFTVVAVGKNAFAYSENLRAVYLPATVVELKLNAFRECPKLNKVTLPDNLKVIGESAFNRCMVIDSLIIPQNISVIRYGAFREAGCKFISIPEKIDSIGFEAFAKFHVDRPLTINNELFAFPKAYTASYQIPKDIVAIREHAFDGCNISGVAIDENVKSIGSYAFSRCVHIESIVIPNSIEHIPDNCFDGCSHLQSCFIGNNVKNIGIAAFSNCDELKTIHIPSSVSKIESLAFSGCWHLEQITIDEGLREIGDKVFENCRDLSSITFPSSSRKLGNDVFTKCESLRNVVLSDSMDVIGKRAFKGCAKLDKVKFPKVIKDIGQEAFAECESLKEAVLPVGLDSLARQTFDHCKSLNKIVLPSGIKEICTASLRHCESLTYIEIPSSIKKIGAQAFGSGDKAVLTIKMESAEVPECHEDAFMFRKVNLLIPKGCKDNYIWAKGWSKAGTPTEY